MASSLPIPPRGHAAAPPAPRRSGAPPRAACERARRPAGAFPRAPPRRELADERAGAVTDFDEALCLEVFIGLNDRRGIDPQLGGELSDGWQRSRAAQRAGR